MVNETLTLRNTGSHRMAVYGSEMTQDAHLPLSSPALPEFDGTPVGASYTFRLVRLIGRQAAATGKSVS